MRHIVITTISADAELAADVLWSAGAMAVEERELVDGRVAVSTSLGEASDAVALTIGRERPMWDISCVDRDESVVDSWREYAEPIAVTESLTIVPSWRATPDSRHGITVLIDPGPTFGMGTHPTTRATALVLIGQLSGGERVLDVGTGSGVLAVIAVLCGAESAHGIDLTPACVEVGVANAARNGVRSHTSFATTALADVADEYDVVLANILAPTLIALADDLRRVTAPSGTLVISGVLSDRYEHVLAALSPMEVTGVLHVDGWAALTLRHP